MDGVRVVPARVRGKKLYVRMEPKGPETAYDWAGPAGAHHASIEMSSSTHEYTTKVEWKLTVFNAEGTFLGELSGEDWI